MTTIISITFGVLSTITLALIWQAHRQRPNNDKEAAKKHGLWYWDD